MRQFNKIKSELIVKSFRWMFIPIYAYINE